MVPKKKQTSGDAASQIKLWRSGAYLAVERWWHKARTILRKLERLEWVTTPLIGIMVFVSDFLKKYWNHILF